MSKKGTHSKSSSLGAAVYPLQESLPTQPYIQPIQPGQETITHIQFDSMEAQNKSTVAFNNNLKNPDLTKIASGISNNSNTLIEQLQTALIMDKGNSIVFDGNNYKKQSDNNGKLEVINDLENHSPSKYTQKLKSDDLENNNNNQQQPRLSLTKRSSTKLGTGINETNIMEDEYFGEDNQKKANNRQKLQNPKFFNKLRDHQTQWNNSVFIEFMFYHIVFYFMLGPLINLVFAHKSALMRNLSFWGRNKWFFLQTFVYFSNFTTLSYYFSTKSENIYPVEIVYLQVTILLRIFVISCKYATLPPEKIDLYKNYILSSQLTIIDYYFGKWISQDSSTIYRETYNALQRGEYDAQMFYISFFVNPGEEKITTLQDSVDELKQHHTHEDEFYPPCAFANSSKDPNNIFFYGYTIIYYLMNRFKEQNKSRNLTIYCIIFATIRGFSTFIYRFVNGNNYSFEPNEIFQLSTIIINTTLGYFSSFVFLAYFIRDLQMKFYLLQQIKFMLQYRKVNSSDNKELPTIDFTNPYSLKGWSILRRVILDYGKAFYIRLEVFLSIYIIVGGVGFALMVLQIYNVTNLSGSVVLVCVFEVFIIFAAALFMLFRGSLINGTFNEFKNTLIDYKVVVADLILLKDIYFFTDCKIHSFLRKRTVQKLKLSFTEYDEKEKYDKITKYLSQLEYSIGECDKELDQDILNQPFTLFTIPITKAQFSSIMVALGTVAGTLFQQIIKSYNQKYGANLQNSSTTAAKFL